VPIVWVAGEVVAAQGEAAALIAGYNVAAGLAAAGWLLAGGIAYWMSHSEPARPDWMYLWYCSPNGDVFEYGT
jgi:hypothetical protein